MKLLLSNVVVKDPQSPHHNTQTDILIEDGQIVRVAKGQKASKSHDMKGSVVSPGFCDLFAHFNEPGFEHREDLRSGIQAAAHSGFTDVVLIPNTFPVLESKSDISFIRSRSSEGVELYAMGAVSEGCKGENLTEILDLQNAGAIAFSDGLLPIWNSELLLKALQYVQKFDGLIINRAKDIHLSHFAQMHEGEVSTILGMTGEPSVSEEISIKRDLDILKYTGGRMHFTHLSTAKGVELIRNAKKRGLDVTSDVAINQLIYTESALSDYDANLKVDPPFRSEKDRKALMKGVKEGSIDAIVSSHQPLDPECKELEFDLADFGMSTLPTFYSDLLSIEGLTLDELLPAITSGPRKILRLSSIIIDEGSEAKLAFFNPTTKWLFNRTTNPSKSMNSPKFGKELSGKCIGIYNKELFIF